MLIVFLRMVSLVRNTVKKKVFPGIFLCTSSRNLFRCRPSGKREKSKSHNSDKIGEFPNNSKTFLFVLFCPWNLIIYLSWYFLPRFFWKDVISFTSKPPSSFFIKLLLRFIWVYAILNRQKPSTRKLGYPKISSIKIKDFHILRKE